MNERRDSPRFGDEAGTEFQQMAARVVELSAQLQKTRAQLKRLQYRVAAIERKPISGFFKPKLFTFDHYPPRPLRSPNFYYQGRLPQPPPTIAIVTPSLNQASFIAQTARSILDQRYPGLAYHIQDGASQDATVEIIKTIEPGLSWVSQWDTGQAQAVNLGFDRISGDIMGYLNSDDLLLPGSLAYAASYFDAHPEIDVIYGHRVCIDENGEEIGRWVLPPHDEAVLKYVDYVPQETLFWRRRVWDALGGLDETFQFALDWDFILRAQQFGFRFARVPRFLGCFRVHDDQKTTAINEVGHREAIRLRKQHLGRDFSPVEIAHATRWYMARHVLYHRLYKFPLVKY